MARKKLREYNAKMLLRRHLKGYPQRPPPISVTSDTVWDDAALAALAPLVVKPDMLFGQRGKNDVVALNVTPEEAKAFIAARMNREITIVSGGREVQGPLTQFIVEAYVPHDGEYYAAVESQRTATVVRFGACGGVDIESHWSDVREVRVPTAVAFERQTYEPLLLVDVKASTEASTTILRDALWAFLAGLFELVWEIDVCSLEFNPICVTWSDGGTRCTVVPLDVRAEVDDQAMYQNTKSWQGIVDDFPKPFGRRSSTAEEVIEAIDAKTGASLKFTLLNPRGSIWLLVAGGGASVIYADTVADLGCAGALGNYGEYSGNPTDADMVAYTSYVLGVATTLDDDHPATKRALIVGGGVANFTDVAVTFKGIITALLKYREALRRAGFVIFVRRGGPNYQSALRLMKDVEAGVGVPIHVFGPEEDMTSIVNRAVDYVRS